MTTTTKRYQNDLEHAYLLGYRQAERSEPLNLRAWPGIKRSRVLTACCEQGYEAGLEAMPLVMGRRLAA